MNHAKRGKLQSMYTHVLSRHTNSVYNEYCIHRDCTACEAVLKEVSVYSEKIKLTSVDYRKMLIGMLNHIVKYCYWCDKNVTSQKDEDN